MLRMVSGAVCGAGICHERRNYKSEEGDLAVRSGCKQVQLKGIALVANATGCWMPAEFGFGTEWVQRKFEVLFECLIRHLK